MPNALSPRLAAQTYIFSKLPDFAARYEEMLRALREDGYSAVECVAPGVAAREVYERQNVELCALHGNRTRLDDIEDAVSLAQSLGARHFCHSGLLEWHERAPADYHAAARFLNQRGQMLRERGLELHYHNHEWEFESVENGRTGWELLWDELDPRHVNFCLDIGWVHFAGLDAVPFLERYGERVSILHLRDFAARKAVPLGAGEIDLAAIWAQIPDLPRLRWIVVEQDPAPSWEAARAAMAQSAEFVRALNE